MKSLMICRESYRSDKSSKGMDRGSFITSSSSGDESVGFRHKRDEVIRKEDDPQTFPILSPMTTSDEESVQNCYFGKCKRITESSEINRKVNVKLRKELDSLSDELLHLERKNSTLVDKIEGFGSERSTEIGRMTVKMDSLQVTIEERDREVKELWNVIQMLEDENIMLKGQSERWKVRENLLKKEINDLKVSIKNNSAAGITVSYNALNRKEILDHELSTQGTQSRRACKRRYMVTKNKRRGGRRSRRRQRFMRKISKELFTMCDTTEPTSDKVINKTMSLVDFAFGERLHEGKTVKKAKGDDNEQLGYNASFWSNEEVPKENKCSIWGTGFWPPVWTTVPNVNQQKSW